MGTDIIDRAENYKEFYQEILSLIPTAIIEQNEIGELVIETGIYLLEDTSKELSGGGITDDPKVGCQCNDCHSCKEAGRRR